MPIQKLQAFLDEHGVKYVTIAHSRAFTAQEVAASAHVSGKELAKTVMVKIDGEIAMAVLPASHHIDFYQFQEETASPNVGLAGEEEFKNLFPECELGAMPPFGNLYGLKVYVSEALREDEQIAFNAGTHTELIQLDYYDFERLVKPEPLTFSKMAVA